MCFNEWIYTTIISNVQVALGRGSGLIIYSVIDHTIRILNYNSITGTSQLYKIDERTRTS